MGEKIKGMGLGGSTSMKTNAGEDAEDWIDAFARPETNGCISDLSDLEKMDLKSGKAVGKEGDMGEKIKGMGLGGSTSMKTNAGEGDEDWIDAFASILLHTNESISDLSPDISGIPQGTELGSVLFTLHISEIAKVVEGCISDLSTDISGVPES